MKLVALFGLALLASCISVPTRKPEVSSDGRRFEIIHRPKDGCPRDYSTEKDFFTERDGSKQSACVAKPGASNVEKGSIDVLGAGEGFMLRFVIIPPEEPESLPRS
jgi:hypothetical protein